MYIIGAIAPIGAVVLHRSLGGSVQPLKTRTTGRFDRLLVSVVVLAALLSIGALATASIALQRGQGQGTRFIDTTRVMRSFEPVVSADREMSTHRREWQQNVGTLERELDALVGEFGAPNEPSTGQPHAQAALAVIRKEAELARYRRAIATQDQRLQREKFAPALERLNQEVQAFATARRYALVLGPSPAAMFSRPITPWT